MNNEQKLRMHLIRVKTALLSICTFILSFSLFVLPVAAQNNYSAPILVDGKVVFEVTASGQFTAKERAEDANRTLNRIIRENISPLQEEEEVTINVTVDNGQTIPVLKINGNHLLSVTPEDKPQGRSLDEQARIWKQQLESAIAQAKRERTASYLVPMTLASILIIIIAGLLIWAIGLICERWINPYLRESETPAESHTQPFSSTNTRFIAFQVFLNFLRSIIILIALGYISTLFPQTRHLSRQLRDTLVYSLTSDLFPLGNNAYSVLDLIILIALFTALFIGARSIKQVLRLRVLSLTGLSRAAQETIALVANYSLVLIGALVLLQIWGLDISSLTVFAGVLGVGIGLGIQGIAKEFVSGLVLIFERPIQAGDFVEVGDLVGTVEHISVRSTEITTLDRVSVILPNSRFLESEVVNWSHRSPVSRLRIRAGVAYGSNVELVRQTLLDAAHDHTDVLSIPPPNVFFLGFGDSSLDFDLLAWISEPRKQFQIKSDLYFLIYKLFTERGIEIPFPQRDLHVRSGNLPVELTPELTQSLSQLSTHLSGWLDNQSPNGKSS
ncbi:MscS Mechanosensitive ion channel [Halothece sp. PCC 7418]|uniref:mechanosensitive ion channel family protein n=1 Tax=Halothece sp. (strain PCC 7418) TaxID=65093 RepID=UPI0002A07CEB|nr:mechanosensitive ion channel domain-containing protein [Halothece sp. PCC 7418]AFZ42693.1 MscS Mechanosensitive ion channel [Halothece sp. PCC 7418]